MGRAKNYPIFVVAVLAACFTGAYFFVAHEPEDDFAAAYSHHGTGNALDAAYQKWVSQHEQNGGDANVTLALGWSKAFSKEFTRARGRITLNLIEGSVSAHVLGLENQDVKDVWLVDNQPGPGRSAKPEPGDKLLWVGSLEQSEDKAELAAELGAVFDDFEVDAVVVTHSGKDPTEPGVLYGSPRLFQRLYTQARTGRFDIPEDSSQPALAALGPRPAYAQFVYPTMKDLVKKGEQLFFEETFDGNGRTCGTCHPAENNFTIDPEFIATLPDRDPLFVAEFVPELIFGDPANLDEAGKPQRFENPTLMRQVGLIVENTNGFDDLENNFTMRGVPHTLAMRNSLTPAPPVPVPDGTTTPPDERTGWSGDGSPTNEERGLKGTLKDFAVGAVVQHFTKTPKRVEGVDFRLPTNYELTALEAFQLSLGRQEDLVLPLPLKSVVAFRGQEIFMDLTAGKCSGCHFNAGANTNPNLLGVSFNFNFDTGVEALSDAPGDLIDPTNNPGDDGFGNPGNMTFNTPTVVEAADTAPFFHNNSITTIEGAVAFYNSDAFNNSPAGIIVGGINLETTQVEAIAAFLRVLNALENIRGASQNAKAVLYSRRFGAARDLLDVAKAEVIDAIEVLAGAGLHPAAVVDLSRARRNLTAAKKSYYFRNRSVRIALRRLEEARLNLVGE